MTQDETPRLEAPARRAERAGPRWETEARDRVRAGIRRFSKPLNDLVARDANEGDTRMVVNRLLTDVLGFDEFQDLTTEYQVRGEFADYGIRIDRDLIAFIEVKRVATKLAAKHLRQAEMYAVNEGVEWIILTNGAEWRAYHLSAGLPVEIDLALDVNLLSDGSINEKANHLFYLTRESLKRRRSSGTRLTSFGRRAEQRLRSRSRRSLHRTPWSRRCGASFDGRQARRSSRVRSRA